jgi:hypothetical protein
LGSRTPAVSYMSWNNSMTIRWWMIILLLIRPTRYSHLLRNLSTSPVCYRTSLLPEA